MLRSRVAGAAAAALIALSGCSAGVTATTNPDDSAKAVSMAWQPQHAGGTLNIEASGGFGSIDPAIDYSNTGWQVELSLFDGLVAFKKVNGPGSSQIAADLATSMPTVTNGGKTYTFTLRSGIKFSDGRPVTVNDVVSSFRRLFKASSPVSGSFFAGIVGSTACLNKPATCTLDGGVTADSAANTVTFHLTAPDSTFLDKLATPFGSVIPSDTPGTDQDITPIPGTGPYKVVSYDPNTGMKLVRNPYFRSWSWAAQPNGYPDVIQFTFGQTVESEVTEVENGQADWVDDIMPADRLNEIGTKYQAQVHLNPLGAFWYAPLNVNIPPFNNKLAREAVQWAIDKNALVDIFGGSGMASPVCTMLPPSYPEHLNFCDYTNGKGTSYQGPNLAKARALVKASGTKGQPVAVVAANDTTNMAVGQYLQSVLSEIGYKATLKPLSNNIQFNYIQNSKNRVQISETQWYQDYPAASDFLYVLLSCSSYHPGSDNSINMNGYCNPAFDSRMQQAMADELTDPAKARTEWGTLDKEAMSQALIVPLFTPKNLDFVSSRVGHYVFTLEFFSLIDQMWVQ